MEFQMIDEDYYVPSTYSSDSTIHIKIKSTSNEYKNPIILCHGRSLPCEFNWDYKFDGQSFGDLAAESGLTVIMMDALGYGKSSKYKEMESEPNSIHINTFNDFYRDIKDVLIWLKKQKQINKPYVVGWSTSPYPVMMIAQNDSELISGVICYGMIKSLGDGKSKVDINVGNYEYLDVNVFCDYRYKFIKDRQDLFPIEWYNNWRKTLSELKPIRLNGSFVDSFSMYNKEKSLTDWIQLEKIETPILFLRGEYDYGSEINLTYFYDRVGSKRKELIVMKNGTHFSCMETNRKHLLKIFLNFMEL
jgi:pimeloyl-ACP methyl ester carboxylesterase